MDIILITVLLTTGGLCLVTLLTWLSIRSYKSVKFEKRVESSLKHIERWIYDNNNEVNKKINDESIYINAKLFDSENINQSAHGDIYDQISSNMDDVFKLTSEQYDNLNSKIDSRCDKLHDKIEEHYRKTTWLWDNLTPKNDPMKIHETIVGKKVKE